MADVLFFADIEITGGTGVFFFRLLEYLCCKHHVRLILEQKHLKNIDIRKKIENLCKVPIIPYIKAFRMEHFIYRVFRKLHLEIPYLYYRDLVLLHRIQKKYKSDFFIFSQGGGTKWFSVFQLKTPSIFFIHSLYSSDTEQTNRHFLIKQKITFNAKTKIIHVSQYAVESFKKNVYSPILASYAYCIPTYGIVPINKSQRKLQLDQSEKKITVLTIGHVVEYKNPAFWFKIARILCNEYKHVKFIWAGNGAEYQKYVLLAEGDKQIFFIGYQSNTAQLYMNADIYFQPSIMETQGIAVVEAMACGLPCVVSDNGGLPESVQDKLNGFVCYIDNSDNTFSALTSLIKSEKLRNDMGKKSIDLFKKKFTKAIWEKHLHDLFV